jgi:hypothetical protein
MSSDAGDLALEAIEMVKDIAYLDTMNEVLVMTLEFLEEARQSKDDVRMGAYLKMASRSMRCALEIYGDRLAQNRAAIKQGEE